MWEFPKIRGTFCGAVIIRILLLRVLYYSHVSAEGWLAADGLGFSIQGCKRCCPKPYPANFCTSKPPSVG